MKGGSECLLMDQLSRSEQWSNITLFLRKTYRDYINLVQKSFDVRSSCMRYTRGESGKGDVLGADIEKLKEMDASEIHARRLNAKKVLTPMQRERIMFPIADGTIKISGKDQDLRTTTLNRDSPDRGEERDNLRVESDGSSSTLR